MKNLTDLMFRAQSLNLTIRITVNELIACECKWYPMKKSIVTVSSESA